MTLTRRLLWLFKTNFSISCVAIGGGYMVVPLFLETYVKKGGFFDKKDLMEMTAVAQSVPGAIAINLAALTGYAAAGFAGAALGCIASVLPPLIILSFVASGYKELIANPAVNAALKGMTASMAAIMADVVMDLGQNLLEEKNGKCLITAGVLFIASFAFKLDAFVLIFLTLAFYITAVRFKRDKGDGRVI